jgi:ketosteroid isomerase-like protein
MSQENGQEMDAAYDPGAWHDFGVTLGTASAALLGLVSLHLRAVVNDPVLRRRAEIMLGLLAMTLAASAALLIPGQSREALGLELMPIALVYMTLSGLATFRATHSPRGISRDRLARFFIGELSAGLVFAGGLGLLVHALGGAYLVGAGVVLGVLIAMLATWILFIGLGIEQRDAEQLMAHPPRSPAGRPSPARRILGGRRRLTGLPRRAKMPERDTAWAMSQENVELVRKSIDAFNRGDLDAWMGFLSPDVIWESQNVRGITPVYRGRVGAREWIEQFLELFEEIHLEIEQITALGDDRVLSGYTEIGRGRGSGVRWNKRFGRSSGSRRA